MKYSTPKIKSVEMSDLLTKLGPARALIYGGGSGGSGGMGGSGGSGGSGGGGRDDEGSDRR